MPILESHNEVAFMSHAPTLGDQILVADDDRTTRFAVSSMLKRAMRLQP
jgi:hypothetical protein